MSGTGLLIAAPSSGSGKTTVTLGLLRALSRIKPVRGAKSGPDYIDPQFHAAACGVPCVNLDAWAMTPDRLRNLAQADGLLIVEGAMGLFDGALPDGRGSAAMLADILGLPVVLVIDCMGMAQSVAALVRGFCAHEPRLKIAGLILNKVASARHEAMLRRALEANNAPQVLGAIPRRPDLTHPSRHLGLVQAIEHEDLEPWLDRVADLMEQHVDLDQIIGAPLQPPGIAARLAPPAQRIAIAQDVAFAFTYPHILADWRAQGAEISFFSPLADNPVPDCDFVFLPGGYPELHAEHLSNMTTFQKSLKIASQSSDIYGECGGYMLLGNSLTDADGKPHQMAGLLPLETSFAERKLHLGYRSLISATGPVRGHFAGHEFHFAQTTNASGTPLFEARDAEGIELAPMGLRQGRVCGSFAHIIDRVLP